MGTWVCGKLKNESQASYKLKLNTLYKLPCKRVKMHESTESAIFPSHPLIQCQNSSDILYYKSSPKQLMSTKTHKESEEHNYCKKILFLCFTYSMGTWACGKLKMSLKLRIN
jgi:hypothetical protein